MGKKTEGPTQGKKRGGLGRGIDALMPPAAKASRPVDVFFPSLPVEGEGFRFIQLDPSKIQPNPRQPRKDFDKDRLAELKASIEQVGILQPLIVRPRADGGDYELVMGERRLRAAKELGMSQIPVLIREAEDRYLLRDALFENLYRADLNPIEEAAAFEDLLKDFEVTQEELAQRLGLSRPQITNTLRLLQLAAPLQKLVIERRLSPGHARVLLSLKDKDKMLDLAKKIVEQELSVRQAEALAKATPRLKKLVGGQIRQGLDAISESLTARFGTRVRIGLSPKKGVISIDFKTIEDLNRILKDIGEKGFGQG